MKNEGAFLLEWVAHYKALGFDDLVVCTNDCADPTVAMLARLQAMGLARHHPTRVWERPGIQRSALKQVRRYPEVTEADWVFVCDADEFLVIREGEVRHLVAGVGAAEVVTVAWRVFGPAGCVGYEDRPVTAQFTRAEAAPVAGADVATFGKSLFRGNLPMARIGVHAPVPDAALGRAFRQCGPGGRALRTMGHPILIAPDFALAQVNHYALRSFESFLVKRDRGRPNHSSQDMGLDYWRRFDRAEVDCDAISGHGDAAEEWRARLMADSELASLHRAAVVWHRAQAANMAGLPHNLALRAALVAEGRLPA